MNSHKVASFFAGIGGFDLGFEEAGFEVNFQCELQPFCGDVLRKHWPDTQSATDILALDSSSVPAADIWCGGFPCQDLSVARGSLGRHGLNGARSGLFYRFAELARERKPKVILLENVQGLLSSNNGKDFAELLHTLASMKYAVSWRLLNSRYFGVPQSRPRVYICAWLNGPVACGNVLFESRPPMPAANERAAFIETSWESGAGPIAPRVAFCLAATSGRHTGTDWSRTYIAYKDEVRRMTPLECERLQGFPDGWTEIGETALAAEKSDSLRYHALGNAVSVAVIRWVASRIGEQLRVSPFDDGKRITRRTFIADCVQHFAGLSGVGKISGELEAARMNEEKFLWPNAGILWDGAFVANRTPPSISEPVDSDLLDLIERIRPDSRYFLSPNAAEGILRRVDTQGRHLFVPLRNALERLSGREPKIVQPMRVRPQAGMHLAEAECALL